MTRPGTLGELRASGWQSRPVKHEVRDNAIQRIANGQPIIEGILGFEDTVLPQLENALLAAHDLIFLGERGQAKTRMIRALVDLLDEWMPTVAGSEDLAAEARNAECGRAGGHAVVPLGRCARCAPLVAEAGARSPVPEVHDHPNRPRLRTLEE